jgi:hypothetical protein
VALCEAENAGRKQNAEKVMEWRGTLDLRHGRDVGHVRGGLFGREDGFF